MAVLSTRLVLQTLRPLVKTEPARPTFRLISGTLVKRTVADVVPALETNLSGITEVLESLVKSYKGKETEFVGFQKEYGISVSPFMLLTLFAWVLMSRCPEQQVIDNYRDR